MKLPVTTIQRETMDVISAHPEHEPYDGDWKEPREHGWQPVAMRYIGVNGPHRDTTAYVVRHFERFTTKRDGVLVAINGQPIKEPPMPANSPVIPTPAEAKTALQTAVTAAQARDSAMAALIPKLMADTGDTPQERRYARWYVDVTQEHVFVIKGTLPAEDMDAATAALALAADLGVEVVRATLMLDPPPIPRGHSGRAV